MANFSPFHMTTAGVIRPAGMLVLRVLLTTVGLTFVGWALADQTFRAADGFLNGSFVVPTSVGLALLVLAWSIAGNWRLPAAWFAMALVGQAVALQLINAGPDVGYQHYQSFGVILAQTPPVLLGFLVLQTLAVVVGIGVHSPRIWAWLRATFKPWQLAAIFLVFVLTSATVSIRISDYLSELVLASAVQTLQLGTLVLMGLSLPERARNKVALLFDRVLGPFVPESEVTSGWPDRFAWTVAVWVLMVSALLSFFVYERHPHIPDEVAYLYQARYLATGALSMAPPPVPEAFELFLMEIKNGQWYSALLPGWSAVLALGVLAGVPWLVNPVLAAINVLLAYVLLRELYSQRTARIAVFLLGVSPWFVFLGMSYMNHQLALACALLAALGVALARRTNRWAWGWLSGGALGALMLVRPLEAVAIAAVVGLWAIGIGGNRLRIPAIAGVVLGAVIVSSIVLAYNERFTGSPIYFPVMAYFDEHFHPNAHALGFGPDRGMGWAIDPNPGHSPTDGVINSNLNAYAINVELFGWGIGSLLLATVAVFAGRLRRSDYLMLAVITAIFVPHFFNYFGGGPDFGARYWFLMIIPGVTLTARGIQFLESKFSGNPTKPHGAVTLAVLALSVMALVTFFPWRAVDKYHNFREMQPDIRQLAQEHDFGNGLVLIRGELHPDYSSAAVYNPLDFSSSSPIYAWDRSPETRAQLIEAFPERPVWVVEGPSLSGDGFQVIEGPVTASNILSHP